MTPMTDIMTSEDIIILSIVIVLSFIGSIGQDYLAMFTRERKMSLIRILLSTATSSIIVFAISSKVMDWLGIRGLIAASFLGGLVGFELLQRCSSLNGLISILERILDILNAARGDPPPRLHSIYRENDPNNSNDGN